MQPSFTQRWIYWVGPSLGKGIERGVAISLLNLFFYLERQLIKRRN